MKLRKRYTIEYIDNEKDLETINAGTHPAPWELFKTRVFEEEKAKEVYGGEESIDGRAWSTFMLWSICPDQVYISNANNVTHPLFCKMFMELLDEEGNVVYEDYCELPAVTKHVFYSAINNQANKERDAAKEASDMFAKELDTYKAFIKKCHAEKAFDEFRKESNT